VPGDMFRAHLNNYILIKCAQNVARSKFCWTIVKESIKELGQV